MSKKLSSLTRRIAASALAAVIAQTGNAHAASADAVQAPDDGDGNREEVGAPQGNLELKLRLKPSSNEEGYEAVAHRSHRSHSSHRSHYSSRTTRSYSPPAPSSSSSSGSSTYTPSTTTTTTSNSVALGTRTLKLGMEGTDVKELILLLINKGYYVMPESHTLKDKELFDLLVEDAVKKLQTDKGIEADGIVGASTLFYIKY